MYVMTLARLLHSPRWHALCLHLCCVRSFPPLLSGSVPNFKTTDNWPRKNTFISHIVGHAKSFVVTLLSCEKFVQAEKCFGMLLVLSHHLPKQCHSFCCLCDTQSQIRLTRRRLHHEELRQVELRDRTPCKGEFGGRKYDNDFTFRVEKQRDSTKHDTERD